MHHGVRAAEELHEVRRPDIRPRPLEPVEVEAARAPGHADDVLDVRVGTERTDDARADIPRGSHDDDLHTCLLPCRPPTETRAVCPHEWPGYRDRMADRHQEADALVLVDVLADFGHEDGSALFAAFEQVLPALRDAVAAARARGIPVVYANDDFGTWSGDRDAVLAEARRRAPTSEEVDDVAPVTDDAFPPRPRYSAFDQTPLELLLRERGTRRLLLSGTATEMCVAQTAIDAREAGYQATVLVPACASVDARNAALALEYLERVVGARLHRR